MKQILNKVPEITIIYWIIKIAATTLGETGADTFSMTLNFGYGLASIIFISIFLVLLLVKLAIKKYEPLLYWLVFTSTSIAGTAMCDYMDRTMGLGYDLGALVLVGILLAILAVWKHQEKTISVEKILTTKAEIFYWSAFLFANTLGTAAGDYLADDLELGFILSAGIITMLLITIIILHYYTHISKVVLFWFAFVLTRPFGATFGDFLTKPISEGGLNLGTIGSSIFFIIVLCAVVVIEMQSHKKRKEKLLSCIINNDLTFEGNEELL